MLRSVKRQPKILVTQWESPNQTCEKFRKNNEMTNKESRGSIGDVLGIENYEDKED